MPTVGRQGTFLASLVEPLVLFYAKIQCALSQAQNRSRLRPGGGGGVSVVLSTSGRRGNDDYSFFFYQILFSLG